VVQFLKKIPQQDDDKKRAQVCLEILFNPKKTEHYGSFIRCEHGTKTNFENMTHYAIPLVILTWHRMIQEYFWKNDKKSFFQYGNYMPRKQRFPKDTIGLYMIDSTGKETNITSFDMIRHNSDTDVAGHACLSLLEWAKYLFKDGELIGFIKVTDEKYPIHLHNSPRYNFSINGGFSLRKRSKMLECISSVSVKDIIKYRKENVMNISYFEMSGYISEDVFFQNALDFLGYDLPSKKTCEMFCENLSDTTFNEKSLGIHNFKENRIINYYSELRKCLIQLG
jgi:hypothetical protein